MSRGKKSKRSMTRLQRPKPAPLVQLEPNVSVLPVAESLPVKRVNLTLTGEVYAWLKGEALRVGKTPTAYAGMVLVQMMVNDVKERQK